LAELERTLVPLLSHQRELTQLAEKDLAPSQSLAQVNRQVKLLQQEKAALRGRYKEDRQLARQDREVLSHLLGTTLKSDQVPWEVALKAPISGHVIWVNPKVRVGAELPPLPDTFQVGVMDPMVVRAHVFEIEALQLKVGESAELTLDSLPGRVFHAQVSRISWTPVTTGLEQPTYYEVELKVSNPDLALKEGLKAKVVLHKSK
jgi:multidrug resistance efflux pump